MNSNLTWLGRDIMTDLHENPPEWLSDRYQVNVVDRDDDGELWVDSFIFNLGEGDEVHELSAEWIINAMREIVRVGLLGPAAQALIAQALTDESYANLDDSERLVSDIAQIAAFGEVRFS